MINVCVLQLPTLSMSENRIDYYMKVAKDNGARIVLLGEYELNSFFSELKKMPRSIACEQSEHKQELMARLAAKYDLHIVAPIIRAASGAILRQAGIFGGAAQKSARGGGGENSASLKGEPGCKGELNSKSDLNSNDGSNSKGALNSKNEQSSNGGLNSKGALNSCGAHALNFKAANSADGLNLSASIPSNSNASNLKADLLRERKRAHLGEILREIFALGGEILRSKYPDGLSALERGGLFRQPQKPQNR